MAVELEEHSDEDGSTYETTATYRYDYSGTTYTGTRVAIDTGSDNIGSFQHRLYSELRTARRANCRSRRTSTPTTRAAPF